MVTKELFDVVAKWWGDTLRQKPRHDVLGPTRATESAESVVGEAMLNAFTSMWAPIPEEKIVAFETALAEQIAAEFERIANSPHTEALRVMLDVDYDPNRPLAEAAKKAGFDPKYRLPSKTTMKLHINGAVELKSGYRAPWNSFRLENGRLMPSSS